MNPSENDNIPKQDTTTDATPAADAAETSLAGKSVGTILREEREKKGLTVEKVADITKIRPHFIRALENEAWDELPSPALAGGFLRSYGNALGLKEISLITRFHETPDIRLSEPEPLMRPGTGKKGYLILIVFLVLAFISGYLFWKGYLDHTKVPERQEPRPTAVSQKNSPDAKHHAPEEANAGEKVSESTALMPKPAVETPSEQSLLREEAGPADRASLSESVEKTTVAGVSEPTSGLVLNARIKETTWVKIHVDHEEPKEFIFQPGEHYTWKAKYGFELLIGNAAGMDLVLNGLPVNTSGTPGQVILLRLPEGFDPKDKSENP